MSLNAISPTSPTGSTLTLNVTHNPLNRDIQQSNFQGEYDNLAVYGGHFPSEPFRPAVYQQNWSGNIFWQKWFVAGGLLNEDGYPTEYRSLIVRGNVNDTNALLFSRNQPQQYAPAPIAISQYALNTQQVYIGGSDYYG